MYILGLSFFYHDSAAVLIKDGKIIAAVQEERFTRKKHDASFPRQSIDYCLLEASITINEVNYVCFYEKPFIKFERILETYIKTWPFSYRQFLKAIPIWFKEKLWIPQIIKKELNYHGEILFVRHHLSHAASSYLASPFNKAAIITVDGVGEWETTTIGEGRGNTINLKNYIQFPNSLGLIYSAFTYYLGFKVNSAEYKVMGLAPYGEPKYVDKILNNLIDLKEDGSFSLNIKYFTYEYGLKMTGRKLEKFFNLPRRNPESTLTKKHKDIAASLQAVTEIIMLKIVNYLYEETGLENLCLAGGVALNCVANGRILREGKFKNIFIQPASGDAGGALGAALYVYYSVLNKNKSREPFEHAYLGPYYENEEIKKYLVDHKIFYKYHEGDDLLKMVAKLIADQKVVGWFQGRSEFGPRALGNRSILADARNKDNWQRVNLKIKFRENFRPFAPSVLEEKAGEYFDIAKSSPYMLLVAQVKKKDVPAVTHVDGSARIQTVDKKTNPRYYGLIKEFDKLTGCPVVINTSFNVRGEPIVQTPHDAYTCFRRTDMDILVMGNYILRKEDMREFQDKTDWQKDYKLD